MSAAPNKIRARMEARPPPRPAVSRAAAPKVDAPRRARDASGVGRGGDASAAPVKERTSILWPDRATPFAPARAAPAAGRSVPRRAAPASRLPASASPRAAAAQPAVAATPFSASGNGSTLLRPAASQAFPLAGGEKQRNDAAIGTGRIAAAQKSPVQAEAFAQAQLINNDCARSESQVSRIATTRRQQINSYFSGARRGLSDFFTRSVAAVQTFIAGKHAEITAAVTSTLAWIRTTITGTLQAAQAAAGRVRARIDEMLESISTSVQSSARGIADQITELVDSIPLPDIPGIGRIRAAAVSLLNRAVGAVNAAVGLLADFVGWAFNAGMSLLDSILGTVAGWLDTALSLAASAILGVMQMIAQELNRAVALVGSILQRAVLAVCVPILNAIETLIVKAIGAAEQSALAALRANRKDYLAALAEAVTPAAGRAAARAPRTVSAESFIAALQGLGRDAIRNNRMVAQTFEALTGGHIGSIIRLVAAAAARTVAAIAARVARAVQSVAGAVIQAVQSFAQAARAVGDFVRELIRSSVDALGGLVEYIRSLAQGGADKLVQFAGNGLSRMGSFVGRLARNLILGRGLSASLEDAIGEFSLTRSFPGPAPALSFLGPAPAFAGGPILIIGGLVVIIIGGLSVVLPLWLAIVIVVVVILLLILLIYLIWRWLRPRPPPPPPPPRRVPVTIGGGTELWHFAGETPTGYPLEQALVASAGGIPGTFSWSIPRGSLFADFRGTSVAVGPTVTLKSKRPSPARANIEVRVDFLGAAGEIGSASAVFTVQEPKSVRFIRNDDHTDPTFVYETTIFKAPRDQFGVDLPRGVEVNEQFTAVPTADFPGMNWRRGPPGGGFITPPNWLFDIVGGETPSHTPTPVVPTDPNAGVKVYHWPGVWRIGAVGIGRGREVERVTWQKFRGRARHI